MRKSLAVLGLLLFGIGASSTSALAYPVGPISGNLVLSGGQVRIYGPTVNCTTPGCLVAGNPSSDPVNFGFIDWLPAGGGNGTLTVQSSSTGYFSTFTGATDTLKDLDQALYPAGVDFLTPLNQFETVSGTGLNFTLTRINDCASIGTGTCDAGGTSPFNFTYDVSTGITTVKLSVRGKVTDTLNPGYVSNYSGVFTSSTAGTPTDILNAINSIGFVTSGVEGFKFAVDAATVPEPATMLTFGVGALVFGAVRRRKKTQA